jgi:hypothetical protein
LLEPAGTTSTAWSTSGTGLGVNAASGFAGNLLDLQVNGTSYARVSDVLFRVATKNTSATPTWEITPTGSLNSVLTYTGTAGAVTFSAGVTITAGGPIITAPGGSNPHFVINNTNAYLGIGSTNVRLYQDETDILAQRRTTNAQAFRVYGTFTDASNHVRASLSSTSTAVTLAAETAGTGADDIPLNLTAAGTGTVKVNSVAEVVVSSTVAGLPAAPVVGMLTRVTDATAPAVGVTVVGGGAAAALVWYNGASWSVIGV